MAPKKAQRTKGNLKPSSSSQAAQLLAASGHAATGFIGFSQQPAFVPVSETFDEETFDDDFRLTLRKLSKRDTITKIKALQEFAALCSSKDEEVVKAVVPFWPRIYNKVAIDVDHKVRELSQKALAALSSKAGKAMAPHLKSIMGIWVVSMCDTYPTVASAATQAFVGRFPGPKQGEVFSFCIEELFECLEKNITCHTKQTLSDPQVTSEEDMEAKYQRVVTSSLHGLRKVLNTLPSHKVAARMTNPLINLLETPSFWKHGKSPELQVKGGMLSMLSAVCQHCPSALEGTMAKATPFVLSFLDTAEPSIVSHAWDAILSLISAHSDCWQHVNWQKAVWPKVKKVLENACNNQATLVAPCLLPFLDKMPNKNYAQLFDAFRTGLSAVNADSCQSEMNAFMKSFLECVQYSIRNLIASNKTTELRDVVQNQVRTVVQASLSHQKTVMAHTELYPSLCNLLEMVEAADSETESRFWSDLSSFVIGHLIAEFQKAKTGERVLGKSSTPPEFFVKLCLLVEGLVYRKGKEFATGQREKGVRFEEATSQLSNKNCNVDGRPRVKMTPDAETFICDLQVAAYNLTEINGGAFPQFVKLLDSMVEFFAPNDAPARMLNQVDRVAVRICEDLGVQPEDKNLPKSWCHYYKAESDSEQTPSVQLLSKRLMPQFLAAAEMDDDFDSSGYGSLGFVNTIFAFLPVDKGNSAQDMLRHLLEETQNPVLRCILLDKMLCLRGQNKACRMLCNSKFLTRHLETLFEQSTQAKPQEKLWKELYLLLSQLDGCQDKETNLACQTAMVTGCAYVFDKLHLSDDEKAPDTSYLENIATYLLKTTQVVATHSLLGCLVKSMLRMVLQARFFNKDSSSSMERLWLTGLKLIMRYKSAVETVALLTDMCSILLEHVILVATPATVPNVVRVSRLLLSYVLSPASEDCIVEPRDITSRLEFLTKGYDDDAPIPDLDTWDVNSFKETIKRLLRGQSQPLESEADLLDFLFLTQRLSHLPLQGSNPSNSFFSYDKAASLLMFNSELLASAYLVQDRLASPQRDLNIGSYCLRRQCTVLVLLDTAVETKLISSPEFENWLTISRSSLSDCLLHVSKNEEQLREFAAGTDLELLGAAPLLAQHISSDHPAFKAVSCSFLNTMPLSEAARQQIQDFLSEEKRLPLKGHKLSQALGVALEDLLSSKMCQGLDLVTQVSGCISGFIDLAETRKFLRERDTRLQIFHTLLDAHDRLKDEGIHLVTSSDSAEEISSEVLSLNVILARSLRRVVIHDCDKFWEFTLCSVVEWIHFLIDAEEKLVSNHVHLQALAMAVWEIIHIAALAFDSEEPVIDLEGIEGYSLQDDACGKKRKPVTDKAQTEWNEFFSEGVYSPLMSMFLSLTCVSDDKICNSTSWSLMIDTLAAAACHLSDEVIMSHGMTAEDLLTKLCPLLASGHRNVAVAAYQILQAVIRDISKEGQEASGDDSTAKKESESQENESVREYKSPSSTLMGLINHGQKFLECLKLVRLGEHVVTDNDTEERAQSRSYMLTWHLVLELCATCPAELKTEYSQYFKENELVTELMELLFRLVPETPDSTLIEEKLKLKVGLPSKEVAKPKVESREMNVISLQLYKKCLLLVPGQVRSWWLGLDRSPAKFVESFTTDYFSPALIRLQMTSALADGQLVEGVTVKSRPSARELLATCEMTEVNITLTLTLPENFPLGQVEVECDKKVGVPSSQWQRWLRQLHVCLSQQDGGLAQGLKLWKANLDRSFQGLEDCMVCFSVLHPTSLQLPKLTCSTCRHKFHSACLYKWFSSSQKSSCPLCRNLF